MRVLAIVLIITGVHPVDARSPSRTAGLSGRLQGAGLHHSTQSIKPRRSMEDLSWWQNSPTSSSRVGRARLSQRKMKQQGSCYALDGETAGPSYNSLGGTETAPRGQKYIAATPIFAADDDGVHRPEAILLKQA